MTKFCGTFHFLYQSCLFRQFLPENKTLETLRGNDCILPHEDISLPCRDNVIISIYVEINLYCHDEYYIFVPCLHTPTP